MTTYIQINEINYPASITGKIKDSEWNERMSKSITITATYSEAISLFHDNIPWSIIEINEEEPQMEPFIFDNTEYSILGDIIVHTNGTVTVKMGKPTEIEELFNTLNEAEIAMLEGVESVG